MSDSTHWTHEQQEAYLQAKRLLYQASVVMMDAGLDRDDFENAVKFTW